MRSYKQEKIYRKHQQSTPPSDCSFCTIDIGHPQFVEGTTFFKVIKNRFAYSFWDGQGVIEHLMLVPRSHTDTLSSLTAEEKIEYVDILQRYEKQGYDVYARAPQSVMKSVVHQHTHLIKPNSDRKHFVLNVKRPFIRIIR